MLAGRIREVFAVAVVMVVAACSSGGGAVDSILDGSPRFPDDEGVVTEIALDRIVLDFERRYRVSSNLHAFSTYNLELEPMLRRDGHYVQVGLDGDLVVWMAGVGQVLPGEPPRAIYQGEVAGLDGGRVVFADGTTLALGDGVAAPSVGEVVTAYVDAASHRIFELL